MKTITIANIVVELTLISDSEMTGQVYEGKRNNAHVTVIQPVDDTPYAVVSSNNIDEVNYIMLEHKGEGFRMSDEGVYSFIIRKL
jgi:hypothetical protein